MIIFVVVFLSDLLRNILSATAQYVNLNKHPVPVPPSSRLINMNNSTRA